MPVIEQLQPASFRDAAFLVNTESKEGGKKIVIHEYVGSDKRYVEELGLLPPTFTIEAVIHGPDAIFLRLQLEKALNLPGLGTLVHPVYGSIEVKSTTYSVASNQTRIGEFRFSINFARSEEVITLDIVGPTRATIFDNAEASRTAVDNALENAVVGTDVDGYTPNVQQKTSEKIITQDIPSKIDEVIVGANSIYDTVYGYTTSSVNAVRSKVAEFTRFVANARDDMLTIVQQPFEIKNNIKDFYQQALNIVNTPSDLADAWERLIDFGFLEVPQVIKTVIQRNRIRNISALNEHTRLTALINLFEASGDKDYKTVDDIDNQKSVLDDAYKRLMEDFKDDIDTNNITPLAIDADFRSSMLDLRTNTGKLLDEKRQNAYRVVTINPGISSMALTAYRYYGNHDTLDELQDLNPNINHANFRGEIQAVSS